MTRTLDRITLVLLLPFFVAAPIVAGVFATVLRYGRRSAELFCYLWRTAGESE